MKKVFVGMYKNASKEGMVKDAVKSGIRHLGWKSVDENECELAIMWGVRPDKRPLLKEFKEKGIPYLIMDYPFWNRPNKHTTRNGYFKVSLNDINPTPYLDLAGQSEDRYYKSGGGTIEPWRKKEGFYILVAGMGPKGCKIFDYGHGEWDRNAIKILRQHTGRHILYRHKPSDKFPPAFAGVQYDDVNNPFDRSARKAYAVVTHHGNSSLDALRLGVPAFCTQGPATLLCQTDLREIENPIYPEGREDLFYKLANWQWHFDEICLGKPFKHLIEHGLING